MAQNKVLRCEMGFSRAFQKGLWKGSLQGCIHGVLENPISHLRTDTSTILSNFLFI